MKRFIKRLLVVDGVIAIALVAVGAWRAWDAEAFMVAFMVVSALALLATGATLGRVAPTASVGPGGGLIGRAAAQTAQGEETIAAYQGERAADRRDPARRRVAPGGPRLTGELFLLALTTAVLSAATSVVAWRLSA